jgi:uncharacterized membrane protein
MFIALIQRIALLQVNQMLVFTGEQRRRVITKLYPRSKPAISAVGSHAFQALPCTQTLLHQGRPRSIQALDVAALVNLARASWGVIEMVAVVGDTLVDLMPLLHVYGAKGRIDERDIEKVN